MITRIFPSIILIVLVVGSLSAQNYNDYVGAGHNVGITITASSSDGESSPDKTMDASGMESRFFAAGRFLNQATLGAEKSDIEVLYNDYDNDFNTWIDDEFAKPMTPLTPTLDSIWDVIFQAKLDYGLDTADIFGPWTVTFNYAWWQVNSTNDDELRHKIAYALSQILVVSSQSDLNDHAEGLVYYYDILLEHSFGNFQDLLRDVTYSVPMGYYLSHFNNPKEDPANNIHPDENYAREIMQLFSIGLYELNNDGTRKLDASGGFIPTYGQDEIKEFAQVFTGLGPSAMEDYVWWVDEPAFGYDFWSSRKDTTMHMYQNFHDESEKVLLNGYTLPAGQSGTMDIDMAVEHLFNHPNVGPFFGRQLIQRLVKSNPSPEYIGRVASAFNDNGSGVRGDMKAVIKAVLLDPEARDGAAMLEETNGRLKEPMLRATNFAYNIGIFNDYGNYWHNGFTELWDGGQHVLSSPTVFNFYPPAFQPNGEIRDLELVAPEFQLHNTAKAVTGMNRYFWLAFGGDYGFGGSWEFSNYIEDNPVFTVYEEQMIYSKIADLLPLSDNPEDLINELDRIMTFGQMSDETRNDIRGTMSAYNDEWNMEEQRRWRTGYAIYLLLFAPEYNVIK